MRVEHSLLETATTLSKGKVRGLQADLAKQEKLVHSLENGIGDVQVTATIDRACGAHSNLERTGDQSILSWLFSGSDGSKS